MIELTRAEGVQWDAVNARKGVDKHDVSRGEAEQVFFNDPLLLVPDERHSHGEPRFHALGRTDDGRSLLIAFAMREDGRLIRVISARDMNRRERVFYEPDS